VTGFLIKWFVNIVSLLVVIHAMPGIRADSVETAAVAALVLGLVNAFLRPFVILFTLPINVLSLGFFTLVINAFLFWFVSRVVSGFSVAGFWSAFWGSLLFSVVSFLLNSFVSPRGTVNVQFRRSDGAPRRPAYDDAIDVDAVIREEGSDGKSKERNG